MSLPLFYLNELFDLKKEMDNFFTGFTGPSYPLNNLYEKDGKLYAEFQIPGVAKENISLSLKDNTLTLECNIKKDEKDYQRSERHEGEYKKCIELPYAVNPDKVEADYNDGILKVVLSKAKEAELKKITIK